MYVGRNYYKLSVCGGRPHTNQTLLWGGSAETQIVEAQGLFSYYATIDRWTTEAPWQAASWAILALNNFKRDPCCRELKPSKAQQWERWWNLVVALCYLGNHRVSDELWWQGATLRLKNKVNNWVHAPLTTWLDGTPDVFQWGIWGIGRLLFQISDVSEHRWPV